MSTKKLYRTVPLDRVKDVVVGPSNLHLISADIPKDPGQPLAIVNYTVAGERQPLGLRIDIGKKVFLDFPDNHDLSEHLKKYQNQIISEIQNLTLHARTLGVRSRTAQTKRCAISKRPREFY